MPVGVAGPGQLHVRLERIEHEGTRADGSLGHGAVVDDLVGDELHVLGGPEQVEEGRVGCVQVEPHRGLVDGLERRDDV